MNNSSSDPAATCLPGLRGRRVVVTAGASGIGFAIARFLHAQGAQLAICDVDAAALKTASASLGNCGLYFFHISSLGPILHRLRH